uniref:Uncharacterized protein n=1 Tax=Magallana gigas TaxID=29159 RepID=K1PP49_MAGGI
MAAYTKNESKHKKYHLDPRDLEITVPHGGGILCKILPNEPRTVVHPPTNLGDSVTATVEGPLEDEVTYGIRVDAREATTAPLVGGLA